MVVFTIQGFETLLFRLGSVDFRIIFVSIVIRTPRVLSAKTLKPFITVGLATMASMV